MSIWLSSDDQITEVTISKRLDEPHVWVLGTSGLHCLFQRSCNHIDAEVVHVTTFIVRGQCALDVPYPTLLSYHRVNCPSHSMGFVAQLSEGSGFE